MSSFGARLREARKQKNLTQDDLGKGIATGGKDAGKAVVYGWEKDQHMPRVDQLTLICEKLGVTSDWLLFGRIASELSPEVAELAASIDKLKGRQRGLALRVMRDIVEAADEANSTPKESTDSSDPYDKRRTA